MTTRWSIQMAISLMPAWVCYVQWSTEVGVVAPRRRLVGSARGIAIQTQIAPLVFIATSEMASMRSQVVMLVVQVMPMALITAPPQPWRIWEALAAPRQVLVVSARAIVTMTPNVDQDCIATKEMATHKFPIVLLVAVGIAAVMTIAVLRPMLELLHRPQLPVQLPVQHPLMAVLVVVRLHRRLVRLVPPLFHAFHLIRCHWIANDALTARSVQREDSAVRETRGVWLLQASFVIGHWHSVVQVAAIHLMARHGQSGSARHVGKESWKQVDEELQCEGGLTPPLHTLI